MRVSTMHGSCSPTCGRRRSSGQTSACAPRFTGATREGGRWKATIVGPDGREQRRDRTRDRQTSPDRGSRGARTVGALPSKENVRHVKEATSWSPRVHAEDHAYILQNADNRIVFVIPFEGRYSLIGTTDVPVAEFGAPRDFRRGDRLPAQARQHVSRPHAETADIVWTFAGIRPLYDDGSSDPSAITRDYVLKLDGGDTGAPLLSVYGGKITTYRKLAEHVLDELEPFLPGMKPAWTKGRTLPGGDLPAGGLPAWTAELARRYPGLPPAVVAAVAHRHGSLAVDVLGAAEVGGDLGEPFGAELTEAEVRYMVRHEWARTADDVLWRRSKCGLGLDAATRARCGCLRRGRVKTASSSMRPLAQMPAATRGAIRGVFTDIDDTLSTDAGSPPKRMRRSSGWSPPASS